MLFSKKRNSNVDMLNGPLFKSIISYVIPIVLSGLLQLSFNAADIAVVGHFAGDNALAGVGSTGALYSLITNLFIGLSVGANVMAARARGEGSDAKLSRVVHTSVLLALVSGLGLSVVGFIFTPTFLRWMGSPDGVIQQATLYLRICFAGMVFSMLYNFGSAILRAVGDTRRPLIYLTLAGVINVVLNVIFVAGLGMTADGVALATVLSQSVSAILVIISLMRSNDAIHLELRRMRFHKEALGGILRIGLPAGIQAMTFSISNVMIQSTINSFGPIQVAGNSAGANLDNFVNMGQNSFYQACLSFVSQNYGAKNFKRIKKVLFTCLACVACTGTVLGVGMWLLGSKLLYIYTTSELVVAAGMIRLTWVALPYVFCGLNDTVVGALRGMGYSVTTMIGSLIGICGFRLLWVFTVCRMPPYNAMPASVYVSYPVSWILTLMFQSCFFVYAYRKLLRTGR